MSDLRRKPDDDMLNAYIDGEATPEERALVESDASLEERIGLLRRVSEAVRVANPPSAATRERNVTGALAVFETKPFHLPTLETGAAYAFRLYANVTRSQRIDADDPASKSKRRAILDPTEQLAWLTRKLSAAGAETVRASALPGGKQIARKSRASDQRRGVGRLHNAVAFSGLLRVQDGARLAEAVAQGIGPAKAYGYGLLLLASARQGL